MVLDIRMPKMGESLTEGTVVAWMKKPGERVERDEVLFEIETDKVTTDIPSPAEGVLIEVLVGELQTVPVGTVVARLETEAPALAEGGTSADGDPARDDPPDPRAFGSGAGFLSPAVMELARQAGLTAADLAAIPGTGEGGRLTKRDLKRHIESTSAAPVAPAGVRRVPMDSTRRRIAKNMVESRDRAVHVTQVVEVDMSRVDALLRGEREARSTGPRRTYLAFVAHATAAALVEHPYLNASIDGDDIVLKGSVNLGIAVAVEPHDLVVPNIKNAPALGVRELAAAIGDLAERARSKSLATRDVTGGTFSITNYGVFGSLLATPIINQPELAILGVGAVTRRAVVVATDEGEAIAVRPMVYLSLGHDHRLIDGLLGGRFLATVKEGLESFDEAWL